MASTAKLQKKANKAISRAERAIEDAQHAARKLDRATRAKADALEADLAKTLAGGGAGEKSAKRAKAEKPANVKAAKTNKDAKAKPAKAGKDAKAKPAKPEAKTVPEVPVPETSAAPSAPRDYRTVAMLRGQAHAAGIHGYSSMTRAQLIDALAAAHQ